MEARKSLSVVLPPKQLSSAVFGSHSASFIQDSHVSLMGY